MVRAFVLICVLVFVSAAVADDRPTSDADRAAIEAAIYDYFDGIGGADAERLNRAFAAGNATMVGLFINEDGKHELTTARDMEKTLWRWAANDKPEGMGRDGEIIDMSVVDGKIAMVMFRYKDQYYDILSLLKIDGAWKIVSKTFYER